MPRRRRVLYLFVGLLIAGSVAVRVLGLARPYPTSGDEAALLDDLRQTFVQHREGKSVFAVYADTSRHTFVQKVLAYPLISVFGSPERAAFGLSAIAGVMSIAAVSLTAARMFSPEAAAACAVLMMISILHANYSVKVLGVIHSHAAFSLALLCFVSPVRIVWWLGGALLGLSFLLHNAAGLPILAVGAAIAGCDIMRWRSLGLIVRKLVRDRLPVAFTAAAVVLCYAFLHRRLAGFDYISRIVHHENLSYPAPQSRFYWVRILSALDPVVVSLSIVSLLTIVVRRKTGDLFAALNRRRDEWFIDAQTVGAAAALTVAGFTASRALSGMARLLFVSAAIWFLVAAAVVASAWQTLSSRQRSAAFATVVALALPLFGLATHDWIATRETRAPVIAIVSSHWQGVSVTAALNYPDFLFNRRSFELLKRLGRTPDIVLGRPWYFDVPFYEEEPAKNLRLAALLSANDVITVTPRDLVNTTLIYAFPPFTRSRCAELRKMLPRMSNMEMTCRPPSFVRFPPEAW